MNSTVASYSSDETAESSQPPITPPVSSTIYQPEQPHPTSLFSFPTPPAYVPPANPFSHLSPIATGSTSEIYKCIIKRPDIVQLEINGELQSNAADVTAQFKAELRVYTTVTRHRNILAFMGCLDGVGMVLEHVEGRPMLDVIRNPAQPLSRETKIDFHNQLLSGLSHLHTFGLSHGDLSLLNVHVTRTAGQTLKILDFGRSVSAASFLPYNPDLRSSSPILEDRYTSPLKRLRSSTRTSSPSRAPTSYLTPPQRRNTPGHPSLHCTRDFTR